MKTVTIKRRRYKINLHNYQLCVMQLTEKITLN